MLTQRKVLSISVIIVFAISNLMLIQQASAVIPTPSKPEFTAKFEDNSYDVPKTTSTDPYTGKQITNQGYRVLNYTIEVAIRNQPFAPIIVQEGDATWTAHLYYNVRFKGHFINDWTNAYLVDDGYPPQSNGTYTVLTFGTFRSGRTPEIAPGGAIDFQVQALIGQGHRVYDPNGTPPFNYPWVFDGKASDWSSTKTVTNLEEATTESPAPTQTATYNNTPIATSAGNLQINDLVIIVVDISAVIITIVIATAAVMISRAKKRTS